MNFVSLVGFAAGTLCTLAYLPQALHSFRTKSVRDISLIMLVSLNVGLLAVGGLRLPDSLASADPAQRDHVPAGVSPAHHEAAFSRTTSPATEPAPEFDSSPAFASSGAVVCRSSRAVSVNPITITIARTYSGLVFCAKWAPKYPPSIDATTIRIVSGQIHRMRNDEHQHSHAVGDRRQQRLQRIHRMDFVHAQQRQHGEDQNPCARSEVADVERDEELKHTPRPVANS